MTTANENILFVNSEKELDWVIHNTSKRVTIVEFYADWCGACKMIGPMYKSLASKHKESAEFIKVDVDHAGGLSDKYKVRYLPAFLVFENGDQVAQFSGARFFKLYMEINRRCNR